MLLSFAADHPGCPSQYYYNTYDQSGIVISFNQAVGMWLWCSCIVVSLRAWLVYLHASPSASRSSLDAPALSVS